MASHGLLPASSLFSRTSFPTLAHKRVVSTEYYASFVMKNLAFLPPTILPGRSLSRKGLKEKRVITRRILASAQPLAEELVEDKTTDSSTNGNSIRRRFLDFYAARGHKVLPSGSLVPDEPTVLLTIAGMLQFKPIFLGKIWFAR
ncbi:hypothetical protein Ancab_028146 [Ancistrocladus abbreviatus]